MTDVEGIQGEVFQYGLSDLYGPGQSMHSFVKLPRAVDSEKLVEQLGAAVRSQSQYGRVQTSHGPRTFSVDEDAFVEEREPVYERVSATKLRSDSPKTEAMSAAEYKEWFRSPKDGEIADKDVEVDEWNFYVNLDGQVNGYLVDCYSIGIAGDEQVFDDVFDQVFASYDSEQTEGWQTDNNVCDCSHLFHEGFADGMHSYISFDNPAASEDVVEAVYDAVEDTHDFRPQQTIHGPNLYRPNEDGRLMVDVQCPLFTKITARESSATQEQRSIEDMIEKLRSISTSTTVRPEGIDQWNFYVEMDDTSTGVLVDRFATQDKEQDEHVFEAVTSTLRNRFSG